MKEIMLSGFADEAAGDIGRQMDILRKNGVLHMEVRNVFGKNIVQCTDDELKKLREILDAGGFGVSAIGSPVGKIGIGDDFAAEIGRFKRAVAASLTLGARYIRAFSFYIPKGDDPWAYKDEVVRRLKALTAIAFENGVVYALENESGLFGDTSDRCLFIVENVNGIKIVFDPGNFVFSSTNPYPDAYEALKNHICYFHAKDAIKGYHFVPSGEGEGNMAGLLKAAYGGGFDGFLSVEPHLGYIEGLTDAQRFTKACNALKKTLNIALGASLEYVEPDEV